MENGFSAHVLVMEMYFSVFFTDNRCCMFRACLLDNIGTSIGGNAEGFFVQLMKTFMSAKILYTPDNHLTRKIIEKVSETWFDFVVEIECFCWGFFAEYAVFMVTLCISNKRIYYLI